MQWIAFNERKPAEDGEYLICSPSEDKGRPLMTIAWWNSKSERWELFPSSWAKHVTHWMPLVPPSGALVEFSAVSHHREAR